MKYKRYNIYWQFFPYAFLMIFTVLLIYFYENFSSLSPKSQIFSKALNKIDILNSEAILSNFNKIFDDNIEKSPTQKIVEVKINKGDTFTKLLIKNNIGAKEADKITSSLHKLYNLNKLRVGQQIYFIFDKKTFTNDAGIEHQEYQLSMMRIKIDNFANIEITNQDDEYIATKVPIALKKYLTRIQGTIENSLIETAAKHGISTDSILALARYYSYDIDFQRDLKRGDEIELIFERYYDEDGTYSHDGEVLFSSLNLVNNSKKFNLYRYENAHNNTQYFSEDGSSIVKQLLKTPINVAKISSGFGIRKHPILGYSKMHQGVDFAASIGTPIFAAGSGVIEEIGRNGAYGNYIKIRHPNNYSTAYAHASSFAKNLNKGSKVKQGEIIAYVGTTGRTTGPHLHYEVLVNNKHINPLKMNSVSNFKLSGDQLKKFNKHKEKIEQLTSILLKKSELEIKDI